MCDSCNDMTFVLIEKNGYEYVFDCYCRLFEKYGNIPKDFLKKSVPTSEREAIRKEIKQVQLTQVVG